MAGEIQPYQASYQDIERMAGAICKSGLFGIKQPEQAIALMLIAQAEGIAPVLAARDYHIIQGRPALKADAMLARYQAAGGRVEWAEMSDVAVAGIFSHAASPRPVTIRWTIEDAKRAGLTGKDNWRAYPRQMLRARVISEGIRATFPGVTVGTYTVEEVQDMTPLPAAVVAPQQAYKPAPQEPAPITVHAEVVAVAPPQSEHDEPSEAAWLAAIEGAATMDELEQIRHDIKAAGTPTAAVAGAWSRAAGRLRNGRSK